MKEFPSYQSYHQFERMVRTKNRYIYDQAVQEFFQAVLESSKSKIEEIKEGCVLWRAQLGYEWEPHYEKEEHVADFPTAFCPERMKPLQDSAAEGRANPKGIPYLYLSTDRDTAMAEVRPWIGSYISLAQFELSRSVKIINCTCEDQGIMLYLKEPDPEKREAAVWRDIDRAFSRPVIGNEATADYAPTQIISELFKSNGFDGIAYRSSLGKGHNITLFDLCLANLTNCTLYDVKKVSFEFDQMSNTYFMPK